MILDGQCKVLATPGHISLYFPTIQTVITGDAAVRENDELVVANPQLCLDLIAADQSLKKLKNLQAKTYYCYHSGKFMFRN